MPVRIQGGTHQTMVDSGCMQSIDHQNLIRPGALIEAGGVDIRCVHGDIHTYPVVLVEIQFKGKKHSVKAVVNSRLTNPLILGTETKSGGGGMWGAWCISCRGELWRGLGRAAPGESDHSLPS